MANMLYNGVELPDINEVWTDKETYPYAYVVDYLSGSRFYLYMVSEPCFIEYYSQYSADFLFGPSSYRLCYYEFHYTSSPFYSGIWEPVLYDRVTSGSIQNVDKCPLIWTSSDVLNSDGSVYLSASEPVDPNAPTEPTYDRTAFLSGMAMGLTGKGNPTSNMTTTGGASDNESGLKKGSLVCNPVKSVPSSYKGSDTLRAKSWNGLASFYGKYIWSDGTDIYYSNGTTQCVLNGDTLNVKSWSGLTSFYGNYIWSDGTHIYYSNGTTQYILNGDIWETKTWNGLTSFHGDYIWSDGTDIYYSYSSDQYILNGDTWEPKTWNGLTSFSGAYIWSDGTNIYYSYSSNQYVLNGDTWESKSWNGLASLTGDQIWSDGTNIYYSNSSNQYVLNGDTWEPKTWNGLTSFSGAYIWSDGTDIYYSLNNIQYVLNGTIIPDTFTKGYLTGAALRRKRVISEAT